MIDLMINFVNSIKDFGLERVVRRYYSLYRGQVTSVEDPDHRGRILVKIPGLFGDEPLPHFAEPRDFRSAGKNKGEFFPPDIDDFVFVEFEMGDQRFPVYSGGWHAAGEVSDSEFVHDDDVPTSKGFQNKYGHVFKFSERKGEQKIYMSTPQGHFFILDDTDGSESVHLIHKTGARLIIDEVGSFKYQSSDGAFVSLDAEQSSVMVNSSAGATVTLKDDIIILNAAGDSMLHLDKGIAQLTTAGDMIQSGNSWTVGAGAINLNAQGAALKMGTGLIALGTPACELIDQVIQVLNALITAPTLVTTPTGPSSPITPPASVQLTQAMVLLTTIKGSV